MATIVGALIQRTWNWNRDRAPRRSESLEYGAIREGSAFSVHDLVKVLDLRESPSRGEETTGVARLTDSYLIRRESNDGNGAIFLYSTSGELSGECVSHPTKHQWGEYASGHMAVNRVIAVDLEHLAAKNMVRVTNEIVFRGAYDKRPQETFETHIERPVRSLTFVLIFDPAYPCSSATGEAKLGRGQPRQLTGEHRPLVTQEGTMLYWRILPTKGKWLPTEANYILKWQWGPRKPAAAEVTPSSREAEGS
ncbi:hypothetical protein GCM10022402_31600 [Salinactinospora qingdaonensis]|uniref:Uncharacterized protein n=1 Tax=Salinactinospora qingdaonensis TaxID=702744 RepID=A0ABP7FZK6_9ACTN